MIEAEESALLESPNSSETSDEDLKFARHLLWQGNFAQAELHLRKYWQEGGKDPMGNRLLEMIAHGYGVHTSFRLNEKASTDSQSPSKYLLIKAWGHGFWSDVHHVLGQLLFAELLHRTPIVHWGENSLFRENDETVSNAYPHFFLPPSTTTIEDLPDSITIYPGKWNRGNLALNNLNKLTGLDSRIPAQCMFSRNEDLLVSDFYMPVNCLIPWISPESDYFGKSQADLYRLMCDKYLKPTKDIETTIDALYNSHMAGRDWVAVHVRGTDKVFEDVELVKTNADYERFIDRIISLNPDIGIFLLTDSVDIHREYQNRYGTRLITTNATRSASQFGVHYSGHSGIQIGREVVIDVFLAARCDYFIGNQGSNVSIAISNIKAWPPKQMFLLGGGPSDFYLYTSPPRPVDHCRLCGAPVRKDFEKLVLGKYWVGYHNCSGCGALQTDAPHWLEDAYSHRAEIYDTGKASRTLANFLALPGLLKLLGVRPGDRAIDFGGGTGLFGRLMRDFGYNFYTHDKYGSSEFMGAFTCSETLPPCKLITLFEVAEHFPKPLDEWKQIFACDPEWVIGSTGLYAAQGPDWPYLSAESGQHLFFYSANSIAYLAQTSGRFAYTLGMYFLICKTPLSDEMLEAIAHWDSQPYEACKGTFNTWIGSPYERASEDNDFAAAINALHRSGRKIAIDGTFFRYATGIARVWRTLLSHWSATLLGDRVVVIDRGRTAPRLPGFTYVDVPHYDYAQADADQKQLQDICDQHQVGLFVSTYYTTPLTTPSALLALDMIPEVMGYDLENPQWQTKRRAIEYASHFLSISENTERDLIAYYPGVANATKEVTYCGCDFRPSPAAKVDIFRSRYGISRPYFLISGVRDGPKNAELFFRAFERLGPLRSEFAVVCTNANMPLEPPHALMTQGADVHMVVLNDEELQCAFSGAAALVYPSRYEGFGLPVLEAMACHCPVITCRNSSISEVGGEAVIYVDPDNVDEMQSALTTVLNPKVRQDLIAKGADQAAKFSWAKMARGVGHALAQWAIESNSGSTP